MILNPQSTQSASALNTHLSFFFPFFPSCSVTNALQIYEFQSPQADFSSTDEQAEAEEEGEYPPCWFLVCEVKAT
jgi:hypothetical protein